MAKILPEDPDTVLAME